MPNVWHTLCAGNEILFDHFGGKDRRGRVMKVTQNSIHILWKAPSSGIERIVIVSTKIHEYNGRVYSQFQDKNIRVLNPNGNTPASPAPPWQNETPPPPKEAPSGLRLSIKA